MPSITLPYDNFEDALKSVWSDENLLIVHGKSLKTTPWKNDKRSLKFSINIENIPSEIRRFFCGKELKITTTQKLCRTPSQWDIRSNIRMHFLGSEFFKVRPYFFIKKITEGQLVLGGNVQHHAILPPVLSSIAENFMLSKTTFEMEHFYEILRVGRV